MARRVSVFIIYYIVYSIHSWRHTNTHYSYYSIIWYLITFFLHVYIYRKVFNQTSEMVTNCWLHMLASRDGKWNQWADIRDPCLSWITNHSYVAKIYFTKVSLSTICKNKNLISIFSHNCQLFRYFVPFLENRSISIFLNLT